MGGLWTGRLAEERWARWSGPHAGAGVRCRACRVGHEVPSGEPLRQLLSSLEGRVGGQAHHEGRGWGGVSEAQMAGAYLVGPQMPGLSGTLGLPMRQTVGGWSVGPRAIQALGILPSHPPLTPSMWRYNGEPKGSYSHTLKQLTAGCRTGCTDTNSRTRSGCGQTPRSVVVPP